MDNIDRISVQKRDRAYKWRYELYKKLFYCMVAFSLSILALLVWCLRGTLALSNQIMLN